MPFRQARFANIPESLGFSRGEYVNFSCSNVTHANKINTVSTKQKRCPNAGLVEYEDFCRTLTQNELEAAQTLPRGYTRNFSYDQAQKLIGNGWTIDVIAHIFSYIRK